MEDDCDIKEVVTREMAAELLSDLVSIDTQNPPGREKAASTFIVEKFNEWNIDNQLLYEPYVDRPQVIAEVGKDEPEAGTLILNGHIDVVPPGDETEWNYDPFGGEIVDGKVYGRGASDMKGGIVAGMLALKVAKNMDIDGKVVFTAAIGEETAEPGTKSFLNVVDGDWAIILEPTQLVVDTVGKGLAWYEVDILGESSHASRPQLGNNVLDAILSLKGPLRSYQNEIAKRNHPLIGKSLCTPTILEAGTKENVIPNFAKMVFDRRFLPSEEIEKIDKEIDELLSPLEADGFDVSIQRTRTYASAQINPDHEIAKVVRRYAHDVANVQTKPHGKDASTDQRNFVNDANIPAIIWGPGVSSQSHTIDEWAPINPLLDSVEILYRTINELCMV